MNVADILQRKGNVVVTIRPTESIAALAALLREKRIGAAVVSGDGRAIDGVISERDIAYGLAVHKGALHDMPVSALMTRTVITCSLTDTVAHAASTMIARNVRHLPVVDGAGLTGMVSIRDVLNLRVDELQQQTAMLRNFVVQTDLVPQDR